MSTPAHTLKVGNLTPVELKDSELVTLHKTIFLKFIKAKVTNLTIRRAIEKLYDQNINKDNIRLYYNPRINIFTAALVTGRLQSIIKHKTH
jgi:hypothetical protein